MYLRICNMYLRVKNTTNPCTLHIHETDLQTLDFIKNRCLIKITKYVISPSFVRYSLYIRSIFKSIIAIA